MTDSTIMGTEKSNGQPAYSVEQLRQEHYQGKSGIEQRLNEIQRDDTLPLKERLQSLKLPDTRLENSGIGELEYVPDFMKPTYIKLINLVKNPQSRYKHKVEGLKDYIQELDSIKTELTGNLYGEQFKSGNTSRGRKVSGLHGELKNLGMKRFQYASAIQSLENEINSTYQRAQNADSQLTALLSNPGAIEQSTKVSELADDVACYKFDLEWYQDRQHDLISSIEGLDTNVGVVQLEIAAATTTRHYVRDLIQSAEVELRKASGSRTQIDYTGRLLELLPELTGKIKDIGKMRHDLREVENDRLRVAAELTSGGYKLEAQSGDEPLPEFFDRQQKLSEERKDRVTNRVKEILKNPFGDIYLTKKA